ncbi:MAG: hypothetical protein ACREO5_10825, partial [Candidatus Binatia bacterium]
VVVQFEFAHLPFFCLEFTQHPTERRHGNDAGHAVDQRNGEQQGRRRYLSFSIIAISGSLWWAGGDLSDLQSIAR